MPRTEARIKTSIWTDEDWLKLSSSAKYLYLAILSQATLNLCGCIAQTKSSWSFATKMTLKMVNKSLLELKREKFIIVDERTEELLVRSFIKNDGVLTKPNVIVAMAKDYLTIRSKAIRQAVIDEIPDGFIASLPERFPKPFAEGFLERLPEGFLEGLGEGLPEPSRAHSSILHPPSSSNPLTPFSDEKGEPIISSNLSGLTARSKGTNPRALENKKAEEESKKNHHHSIIRWCDLRIDLPFDEFESSAKQNLLPDEVGIAIAHFMRVRGDGLKGTKTGIHG
jgi:hypothetical protein